MSVDKRDNRRTRRRDVSGADQGPDRIRVNLILDRADDPLVFATIAAIKKGVRRNTKLKTMLHVAALVQHRTLQGAIVEALGREGQGEIVGGQQPEKQSKPVLLEQGGGRKNRRRSVQPAGR